MPSAFDLKKARILQQLSVPDAAYQDASPKGNVDIGIRALVDEINELDSLVTTSSCAGRIAVYLEGKKKSIAAESLQYDGSLEVTANAGAGGKGGGQWLFVSHDPLTSLEWQDDKRRLSASVGFTQVRNQGTVATTPASTQDVRWIRCKFEPMILHILCASIKSAQDVLHAALGAGFRESGISSVTPQQDGQTIAMVAVRTTGLAFDSVIGYESAAVDDHKFVQIVDDDYMMLLVRIANERFEVNKERTERFREGLKKQFGKTDSDKGTKEGGWEPKEVRKARLRAEGLARQAASQQKTEMSRDANGSQEASEEIEEEELGSMFQ